MFDVSLFVAFGAGIVSFLSPCVLPIVPGFLAYLAGSSLDTADTTGRREIFINSIFFVLGFSVIFAVLGVILNGFLQAAAYTLQEWLSRVGGAVIIMFGLYLTGLISLPFLEKSHTVRVTKTFQSRYVTSFVFGTAFAVGWTPCVGAALGVILGLAATNPGTALYLLFSYALGLGLPFLLVGFFAAQAAGVINRYAEKLHYITVVFGGILIILGILVFTQSLSQIANFELLNRWLLRE
ncbi:MAG: cytochrome C biogenesis protein [Candidatus Ryanbacteria bacterium CG10_big_fil_rev_8_21_14_0_10_43_42]|uniref:Cytochrome C biogenesis protein n=1 Tax=Candidatus Ryanbacteria bacterium CG10_big_fil_rev_8_21_14_0_10_43_42 TaxID=1974864 RepID=A0A2M8KX94_9BACT|nr:MAG: cytochrome C biogenesis protein [Candidatus Ryanbacteria bacterium CG10_big_fil_rev_8_21_14_0_10_43_42]